MKSGNLNFLEPSGPLHACNGTALSFYIHLTKLFPRRFCIGRTFRRQLPQRRTVSVARQAKTYSFVGRQENFNQRCFDVLKYMRARKANGKVKKVQPVTCHEPTTSALGVGGQRHAPTALPPGKRPSNHYTGGWVDPETV